jgi:putative polyhydroxyalkanoate system protein
MIPEPRPKQSQNDVWRSIIRLSLLLSSLLKRPAMADIDIKRRHKLSRAARETAVNELVAFLDGFASSVSREGSTLSFSGKGFTGTVMVSDDEVTGYVTLGLLAKPFRKQLEAEINRHLDTRLGAES